MPAVMASGLPESVPAWYTGPSGATIFIISFLPPYAPTGRPPPITFPRHVISGFIPYAFCAPPYDTLKPVITSSNIKMIPYCFVNLLIPLRKPGFGRTQPIFPTTGSRITQAMFCASLSRIVSSIFKSLNGAVIVFFA